MTCGLLDMPEDVMGKIMEDVGLKGILNLRKVCHDLRKFIDDIKPDANLEEIIVNAGCDSIISVGYHFFGGFHYIEYEKQMEGCLVQNNNGGKVSLNNKDYMTVLIKDFEIVLGHQTTVLKQLALIRHHEDNMNKMLLENLHRILKSRVHPLKVKKFTAENMDQNQLVSILPLLDSKTLDTLEVCFADQGSKIDKLVKLDQWKNLKHMSLNILNNVDLEYIQHFTHLTIDYIRFRTTRFPDLVLLKNIFLQSSGFKIIEVHPTNHDDNDVQRFTELLGGSFFQLRFDRSWYYRIPATNQVLEIKVMNNISYIPIVLSRIDKGRVPHGAVIQD